MNRATLRSICALSCPSYMPPSTRSGKHVVIQAQEHVPDQVRLAASGRPGQLDMPRLAESISQSVRSHGRAVPDQGKRDKLMQAMPVELIEPSPVPGRKLPGRRSPLSSGVLVSGASGTRHGSRTRLP